MKLKVSSSQLFYGGNGGDFHQIQDTGGQSLVVYGGGGIDSIQIGNNKYGGGGGDRKIVLTLPQNGQFQLLELCASDSEVGYLKLSCLGQTYTAGSENGNGKLIFGGSGLTVTFAGISSGNMVDAILFNIV